MRFRFIALFSVLLALSIFVGLAGCNKTTSSSVSPASSSSQPRVVQSRPPATPEFLKQIQQAQEINPDVTAWLQLPNTDINGPVLQAEDNEYYLRRDIHQQYDVWGSYFVDYECTLNSMEELNRVTIVYGHSLEDSETAAHFSQIKKYNHAGFSAENPYIYFSPECATQQLPWRVFAGGVVSQHLNYLNPEPDDETFTQLLADLRAASNQPFNEVQVGRKDKILILSTCTSNPETRFVLVAKLESEPQPKDISTEFSKGVWPATNYKNQPV